MPHLNPVLIFLETNDCGVRTSAAAARRLGFHPIFLATPNAYTGQALAELEAEDVWFVDTSDPARYAELIAPYSERLGGILTFEDSQLEAAYHMSQRFGVRGPDACTARLKDKAAVAAMLPPPLSPPTLNVTLGPSLSEITRTFVQRHGACILKPRKGCAGIGSVVVENEADAMRVSALLGEKIGGGFAAGITQGRLLPAHLDPSLYLIQPLLPGELFSVEGYVQAGSVHVLGASSRRRHHRTELSGYYPVPSGPPLVEMSAVTTRVLQHFGALRGFFHFEFLVAGSQFALIDANYGRPGGGGIFEAVSLAHNVTADDAYLFAIKLVLGMDAIAPFSVPARREVAFATYAADRDLVVDGVDGDFEAVLHVRTLGDGHRASAVGSNNLSWIGLTIGEPAAVRACLDSLRLVSGPTRIRPFYAL